MNRRLLLNTTAIAAVAALAACATTPGSTTVQSVFSAVQFALPLLDVLALGIAVAVQGAAGIVAAVEPYLGTAASVFQTMSATMTENEAKPIVAQVEGYLAGAVKAVDGVVSGTPALQQFAPKVAQARAVLALLTSFVNGVTAAPMASARGPVAMTLLHR